MSATTALTNFIDKLQGLFASDADIAADRDAARKAFSPPIIFKATSAKSATANVSETLLGTAPYDGELKAAYIVPDGTTLASSASVYCTVDLYKIASDGTTTTSLCTWTNATYAFTDTVARAGTLGSTVTFSRYDSFAYSITQTASNTTAQALPASMITIEVLRKS